MQEGNSRAKRQTLIGEYLYFIKHHRAWWMTPIFVLVLVVGALVILGGSQTALLMYALF